jgi:titin
MSTFLARFRQARTRRLDASRKAARRSRPQIELMEGRQLLSTFTVSNTNDSGSGSLRQAILQLDSDNNTTPDTINFTLSGNSLSQYRIALQTPLAPIFRPVTIDATSLEANVSGAVGPVLELDGNSAGSNAVGLQIYTTNATIKGLAIDGFSGGGVQIDGSVTTGVGGGFSDTLANLSIGINNADAVNANSGFGIELTNGAHNNSLYSDVVAGNQGTGIVLTGGGTSGNTLNGVLVGNDTVGHWFRNSGNGIQITGGASNNGVYGSYAVDSGGTGLYVGPGSSGNTIWGSDFQNNAGNAVDLDGASNNTLLSNTLAYAGQTGLWIQSEPGYNASNNTIGGAYAGGANVISGNAMWGVYIAGSGATLNVVQNNDIGTDGTGENAMPNGYNGLDIVGGASLNVVGGTTAYTGNVISGNAYNGVLIFGSHNTVEGNDIGVDASGTRALPNHADGVLLGSGAYANVIGGSASGSRNIISGNSGHGITVTDGGTAWNMIFGNFIGTNAAGNAAVPNHDGVVIVGGATYTSVRGNTISGNLADGVYISGSGTSFNHVWSNYIGLDSSGENAVGNGIYGVAITLGATWDYVGLDFAGNAGANVISANGSDGVYVASAGTVADYVYNNLIGTDASSYRGLGNHGNGVTLEGGATYDYVNGNTISANWYSGVQINGSNTNNIQVDNNVIGTDQGGYVLLGNGGSGIVLNGTVSDNISGNYLWNNGGWGILCLSGSGGTYVNVISGNDYGHSWNGSTNRNGDFAAM